MIVYLFRRLLLLAFVLLGVSLITFVLTNVIPADPVRYAAGDSATAAEVARLRASLGLDQPLPVQYIRYVGNLFRGDFGMSLSSRRPVRSDLQQYLPATIELVTVAFLFMLLVGVPLGVISATAQGKLTDVLTRIPVVAGTGLPVFWLALMMQLVLYYHLQLFPFGGRLSVRSPTPSGGTGLLLVDSLVAGDMTLFGQAVWHLAMPAFALGVARMAIITRVTRASILETLGQDFIRTARAKGLRDRVVLYKHALKVAFVPVLTELGLQLSFMLAGTIVVETVFAWPGIGLYAYSAIANLDLYAIMGVTLVLSAFKVFANLGVDLLYAVIDPRIRY